MKLLCFFEVHRYQLAGATKRKGVEKKTFRCSRCNKKMVIYGGRKKSANESF